MGRRGMEGCAAGTHAGAREMDDVQINSSPRPLSINAGAFRFSFPLPGSLGPQQHPGAKPCHLWGARHCAVGDASSVQKHPPSFLWAFPEKKAGKWRKKQPAAGRRLGSLSPPAAGGRGGPVGFGPCPFPRSRQGCPARERPWVLGAGSSQRGRGDRSTVTSRREVWGLVRSIARDDMPPSSLKRRQKQLVLRLPAALRGRTFAV